MVYSLAVIHDTLCILSLTSDDTLNNVGALIVHTNASIKVVNCHYILTPFVECLWNDKC